MPVPLCRGCCGGYSADMSQREARIIFPGRESSRATFNGTRGSGMPERKSFAVERDKVQL